MIRCGSFDFDPAARFLYQGNEEILLPPKAAGVLRLLLERPGQLVNKDELLDTVWNGTHVADKSLSEAVGLLRQILGDDPRDPTFIQTIHGRGYRFVGAVEAHREDPNRRLHDIADARIEIEEALSEDTDAMSSMLVPPPSWKRHAASRGSWQPR